MLERTLSQARGFLFDLNGVFYIEDQVLPRAAEVIARIRERNLPCRFLTNTSTASRETLHNRLHAMGLPIEADEIFTPSRAAALFLKSRNLTRCHLILAEDAKRDLSEFSEDPTHPEAVVIGDIGDRWNYYVMNKAFEMLIFGAELIALHKGRYWQVESGLRIDIGAFITGLEYAAGKEATVIGKPAPSFFEMALASLNLPAREVVMIGDDLEADVGGAQRAGLHGVLVKTGKYRAELAARSDVRPAGALESIGELLQYL